MAQSYGLLLSEEDQLASEFNARAHAGLLLDMAHTDDPRALVDRHLDQSCVRLIACRKARPLPSS